jgi:hypothetical protein
VSAAAFGEHDEPWGDTDLEDVREVVTTAMQRLDQWLDRQPLDCDPSPVYDALDVMCRR